MANVLVLDEKYDPNTIIWRYMDYWKLEDLFKTSSLYFVSLNTLQIEDKLEGIPSKPMQKIFDEIDSEYSKIVTEATDPHMEVKYDWKESNKSHTDLVYVNCWNMNKTETSWMWKRYTNSIESVVIRSTWARLQRSFVENELLFMGFIQYIDHDKFFSPPTHGLASFMRKNKANYEDEKELRVILDYMFYRGIRPGANGIHRSVDLHLLIDQIICHPQSSDDFVSKVRNVTKLSGDNLLVRRSVTRLQS